MHRNAYTLMAGMVARHCDCAAPLSIVDLGAMDVNGTCRPLFTAPGWRYLGVDIAPGPNVDMVVDPHGCWENLPAAGFDVAATVSTLEHVEMPWLFVLAVRRILKPGGLLLAVAPCHWKEHRYPVDCWRILPDGMRVLMERVAGLCTLECASRGTDTYYAGRLL